jgi:predicted enzyme related to lactoylglutathione lyase
MAGTIRREITDIPIAKTNSQYTLLENSMKRLYRRAFPVCAALLLAGVAYSQLRLDSIRISARDTVGLAKFYKAAFGMQEVNRIENPTGTEVFVNFGATVEEAKANKSPLMVLMHSDSDDVKDPVAHVIFNVKDMPATVAAVKSAGGSMAGDPRPFRNTGIIIGIAVDPAGNRIELIQPP